LLAVGIDWAESFHDVALGRPGQGVVEQFRVDHTAAGIERLVTRCLASEPDPSEVRVVLETRHGLLVEALIDAGFTVLPVNPDLVARRRGPAKKKDDAEDARICCLLALDQFLELRKLIPHGEIAGELRAIAGREKDGVLVRHVHAGDGDRAVLVHLLRELPCKLHGLHVRPERTPEHPFEEALDLALDCAKDAH